MRSSIGVARLPLFLTLVAAVLVLVLSDRTLILRLPARARAGRTRPPRPPRPWRLPGGNWSAFEAGLRRRPRRPERLPELERVERSRWAWRPPSTCTTASALLYAARLASCWPARGIDLDGSPEAARRALGDQTREIVRPDREPPRERFAAGLDLASLRTVVASLEAL